MVATSRLVHATVLALGVLLAGCGTPDDTPSPPAGGSGDGVAAGASGAGGGAEASGATEGLAVTGAIDAEGVSAALASGKAFLLASQDATTGGWGDPTAGIPVNAGYTGMAALGLIGATPRAEVRAAEPIRRALTYLTSFQQENGAVVQDPKMTNYFTSVTVGALAAARMPEFADAQARGRAYLVGSQIRTDETDPSYGGFPYKQAITGSPADLSNLQIAAQALHDAGLPADDPTWTRMQRYLKRVQNSSESNDWSGEVEVDGVVREVVPGDDGGGYYNPGVAPGDFKANLVKRSDGRYEPRSYGSMSYALLKCLLFSGVPVEDPRVERVVQWIGDNWTLDRNPGFEGADDAEKSGQKGLYYYLYTAARALADYERAKGGVVVVRDAEGRPHAWRSEIAARILALQAADGSWRNERDDSWDEGSKVLATSYALQTLALLTNRLP